MRVWPYSLWVAALLAQGVSAQTLVQSPALLNTIPRGATAADPYWQHLVVTLTRNPVPGDTIAIPLPAGVSVADIDGDGQVEDEVSLDDPQGGYASAAGTTAGQLVLVNRSGGLAGPLHVQFPIATQDTPAVSAAIYGLVSFSHGGEQSIPAGTLTLTYARPAELSLASFSRLLVDGVADTTSDPQGDRYPTGPAPIFSLPLLDLVSDQRGSLASSAFARAGVKFGNGDDTDDVTYSFWFSSRDTLARVDSTTAVLALSQGQPVRAHEGSLVSIAFDLSSLAEGTYYLYMTSNLTGRFPLVRSRGLAVRHRPVVLSVAQFEGGDDDYLDSGLLLDFDKGQPGPASRARAEVAVEFAAVDLDDSAAVRLFYARADTLDTTFVQTSGSSPNRAVTGLRNAVQVDSTANLREGRDTRLTWRVLKSNSTQVDSGAYYLYAVATDGKNLAIGRSAYRYRVSHSPFLAFDARQDQTLETGGDAPQRYYAITWNQDNGIDGDVDRDHSASISLYYSASDTFRVPAGAPALVAAAADSSQDTHLIASGLSEDRDGQEDNQYRWDLWSYRNPDRGVPRAGVAYYLYGVITGGGTTRLARWEDGAGRPRRLVFSHSPHLRLKAPLEPLSAEGRQSFQVAWEAQDVDDQARLWVVLTPQEAGQVLGASTTYGQLTGDAHPDWVASSMDGSLASSETLTEGADRSYAVRPGRLVKDLQGGADPIADGEYYAYVVIQESGEPVAGSLAKRAPGLVRISGLGAPGEAPSLEVLPGHLQLAAPGDTASFEIRPHTGGRRVDLFSCFLSVDTLYFRVVDQDSSRAGVQPFALGPGLPGRALVDTLKAGTDSTTAGKWLLDLVYFEQAGTTRFDGTQGLAALKLVARSVIGTALLKIDHFKERRTALYQEGVEVALLPPEEAARISLVPRGTIAGQVRFQGRTSHRARVKFSLRDRNSFLPVADSLFSAANDLDRTRSGIQDSTDADGNFSLTQVPTGDYHLAVHLDQYLDGQYPLLQVNPGDRLTGIDPTFLADGKTRAEFLLGGDVTGYVDTSGASIPDNQVDQLDVDFVVSFFGQKVNPTHAGRLADIDGDSLVWVADLNMVAANFNRAGAEPVYKVATAGPARLELVLEAASEEELEVEVVADGAEALRAYGFKVVCDPQLLSFQGPGEGKGFAGRPAARAFRQGRGEALFGAALLGDQRGLAGRQVLARLRLARAPGAALEKAGVRLEEAELVDGDRHLLLPGAAGVLPAAYRLLPNFPNPFNPQTALRVEVPRAGQVAVEICDVAGQQVRVLVDGWLPAGVHTLLWDGRDERGHQVGSGVYVARLRSGGSEDLRKMLLLR